MMSETKKEGAIASHLGRAERRDNFDYLKNINIPSLVIAGEKDYFFPIAEVEKVARNIDQAEFEIIKQAGHLPNMEKPQVFNQLLKSFYGRNFG